MIKKQFQKHRELILYIFFGGLTTVVNWASYMVAVQLLGGAEKGVVAATAIGQILSILFAYVTNRKWVFVSKARGTSAVLAEMGRFFGCRGASFVLDIILMYMGVTMLGVNDALMKLLSNVVIIILNYALSKLFVFRQKKS